MPRSFVLPDGTPRDLARALEVFRKPAYTLILMAMKDAPGPWFHSELSSATGIKPGTVSQALAELEALGIVHGDISVEERRGRSVRYSLDRKEYGDLYSSYAAYLRPADEENG